MKTKNAIAVIDRPTRPNGLTRPSRAQKLAPAEALEWAESLPEATPMSHQYAPVLQAIRNKGYSLAEATRLLESRTDFTASTLQWAYYETRRLSKEVA